MAEMVWTSTQELEDEAVRLQEEVDRSERKVTAERILLEKLATDYLASDKLTVDEKKAFTALYKPWEKGIAYVAGDKVENNKDVFEVIQPHTSQKDWKPKTVPALFTPVYQTETTAGVEVIPDYVAPTGAQDAYSIGDKVMFEGVAYESAIDANTWSPIAYPQGWTVI